MFTEEVTWLKHNAIYLNPIIGLVIDVTMRDQFVTVWLVVIICSACPFVIFSLSYVEDLNLILRCLYLWNTSLFNHIHGIYLSFCVFQPPSPDDLCLICYTSGTTGKSSCFKQNLNKLVCLILHEHVIWTLKDKKYAFV